MWAGAVVIGDMRVGVRADVMEGPLDGQVQLRVASVADASRAHAAPAGIVLGPAPGSERLYRVAAAAISADDVVAILDLPGPGGARLRSLGEALLIEWGWAESAEQARGFSEADLAVALARVRSLPRHLTGRRMRTAAVGAPACEGAQVIDLAARAAGRSRSRG